MFKKFLATQTAKTLTKAVIRKEVKIIAGTVLTIGTHKLIQKAARKYPSMRFLKV